LSAEAIPPNTPIPTNHPTGFWFFFWGEFAERCSYYGMRAILSLYMIEKLGVEKKDAGTYMSLFIAACYFFPLIGGWIADKFLGKYWTIVLFSLPYVVAQLLVGIENRIVVVGALTLLAMGSGVIKPNISTLMGLTYDQQRPGQDQLRTSAFNYFYMAINIGAWLSQLIMPYLRVNYGYQAAFLFPAALMTVALVIFAFGKRFYGHEVIVQKYVGPKDESCPDGKTVTGIPVKYVAQTADEIQEEKALKLKTLAGIGALFLTVMFFWAIFDQSASTWIFFADTYMTDNFFGIPLTADQVQSFNALFIILMVPISVFIFKQFAKAGKPVKATTKMLIGFGLTALSMFIIAFSAFLAPQATKELKFVTPEGALVLPKGEIDISKLSPSTDSVLATLGTAPKLSSSEFKYNNDKKRVEFKNGSLNGDGFSLTIKDGHISTIQIDDAALQKAGVLEVLLKGEKSRQELADKLVKEPTPADKIEPVTIQEVDWTVPKDRVPVAWQVFAYFIITIAEILISVTGLELAFVAAPKSMKSFVTACWLAVVFLANFLINAPVTQLYATMQPMHYFGMLGIAMALVMTIFVPIASRFNKMMAQKQPD
jgi:solute carrier family 15 (oligopeptide transporter), member 1